MTGLFQHSARGWAVAEQPLCGLQPVAALRRLHSGTAEVVLSSPGDERPRRVGAGASLCPLAGRATAKDGDRDRARATAAATTPRAGANGIPPGPLAAHRPPVNRGRSGTALPQRARRPEMLPGKEPDRAPRRSRRADVPRRR